MPHASRFEQFHRAAIQHKSPLRAAENPTTPSAVLWQLAWHHNPDIRQAVADNRNSNEQTLWLLANDSNPDVRFALAENHHVPDRILEMLAYDENPYVAQRAVRTKIKKQAAQEYSRLVDRLTQSCQSKVSANATT